MFEKQLAQLKDIEVQLKDAKKALYNEMLKRNIKHWTTPNGTKVTAVAEVPASSKMVTEFDVESFKTENPAMYDMYLRQKEVKKNGRAGYALVTIPR